MGLTAYQQARRIAESPKSTEHRLLGQVTAALIDAHGKNIGGPALADILHWNREIWAIFSATCADSANKLPPELRASIISLALWVDRHSSGVLSGKSDLETLIEVNRSVMEGLSAEP